MISLSVPRCSFAAVLFGSLALALVARPAPQGAVARLELQVGSPQAGATIAPGTLVHWVVFARVLPGDHHGLALFAVDLVQDASNPQSFDLPPGERAPSAMAEFDRPAGFTNPSDDPWGSGYGGTPVGPPGARDLVQIGGAQNVFGAAPPCFGPNADVCMGQDVDVRAGVVTGNVFKTVASGRFSAPATAGTYTLSLANGVANLLVEHNAPPAASKTRAAEVSFRSGPSISFTVQ